MKKIKFTLLAAMAVCLTASVFTSCSSDDANDPENLISEFNMEQCLPGFRQDKGCIRGGFPQCGCLYFLLQRYLYQPCQSR